MCQHKYKHLYIKQHAIRWFISWFTYRTEILNQASSCLLEQKNGVLSTYQKILHNHIQRMVPNEKGRKNDLFRSVFGKYEQKNYSEQHTVSERWSLSIKDEWEIMQTKRKWTPPFRLCAKTKRTRRSDAKISSLRASARHRKWNRRPNQNERSTLSRGCTEWTLIRRLSLPIARWWAKPPKNWYFFLTRDNNNHKNKRYLDDEPKLVRDQSQQKVILSRLMPNTSTVFLFFCTDDIAYLRNPQPPVHQKIQWRYKGNGKRRKETSDRNRVESTERSSRTETDHRASKEATLGDEVINNRSFLPSLHCYSAETVCTRQSLRRPAFADNGEQRERERESNGIGRRVGYCMSLPFATVVRSCLRGTWCYIKLQVYPTGTSKITKLLLQNPEININNIPK